MINILLLIIFRFQDLLQQNQPLEVAWAQELVELLQLLEDFNPLISKWDRIIKWEPWEEPWVVAWAKWEVAWEEA